MDLSTLKPARGSRSKKKRLGRGESSGLGKTSGHGGKGQTARSGGSIARHFEGGQTPLYRRVPKIGFRSRLRRRGENAYAIINVADLDRFEAGSTVDLDALTQIGCVAGQRRKAGVKLLGNGEVTKKLTVKVNAASDAARAKIEAQGGTVEIIDG